MEKEKITNEWEVANVFCSIIPKYRTKERLAEMIRYYTKDLLDKQKSEINKEYIIKILTDFNKSQLEGKGFDFFFVLSADLDKLKELNK